MKNRVIAVVGDDFSASLTASLIRRTRPDTEVHLLRGRGTSSPMSPFTTTLLRNDSTGRRFAKDFLRDCLRMNEGSILVSKNTKQFTVMGTDRMVVPTFRSTVSNIPAAARDVFGAQKNSSWNNISLSDFLSDRFGRKFSDCFSPIISRSITGSSDYPVSAMAIVPRLVAPCANHSRGILLGPLFEMMNKKSSNFASVDLLDHLWQRLMSGGPYIGVSDWAEVETALTESLQFDRVVKQGGLVRGMKKNEDGKIEIEADQCKGVFDLVYSSLAPTDLTRILPDTPPPSSTLSLINSIYTSVIHLSGVPKNISDPGIAWGGEDGVIGAFVPSLVFPEHDQTHVYVFHTSSVSAEKMAAHIARAFPSLGGGSVDRVELNKFVEDIPRCPVEYAEDLVKFNRWRVKTFGDRLQVMGKHYYAPTGSIGDIFKDVTELVESSDNTRWMFRNGRSLDGAFRVGGGTRVY
jgi:protoporphyrinogen oxidase